MSLSLISLSPFRPAFRTDAPIRARNLASDPTPLRPMSTGRAGQVRLRRPSAPRAGWGRRRRIGEQGVRGTPRTSHLSRLPVTPITETNGSQ